MKINALSFECVGSRNWRLLAAGRILLPSPCSLKDALIDEVGALLGRYGFKDSHHFFCGIEIVGLGILLLAACSFACAAPALIFLLFLLHNSKKVCKFASKTRRWEGFPSLWLSNPDFESHFDFPNPQRNRDFHKAFGFSFFLLFSRFSDSSVCHLLTLQRYEKYLNLPNFSRTIFIKSCKYFVG